MIVAKIGQDQAKLGRLSKWFRVTSYCAFQKSLRAHLSRSNHAQQDIVRSPCDQATCEL
jgi:hypothetical protein